MICIQLQRVKAVCKLNQMVSIVGTDFVKKYTYLVWTSNILYMGKYKPENADYNKMANKNIRNISPPHL